jgi:hypothetical protein
MSSLYRGPSIDASYQVLVHLAKRFLVDLFKSSPLKPFGQMNRNLIGSIYARSSINFCSYRPSSLTNMAPNGFRGEDLNKSTNQKQELPVVAMFVNGSGPNVQSL